MDSTTIRGVVPSFAEVSKGVKEPATCFACARVSMDLLTCAKCHVANYCDK